MSYATTADVEHRWIRPFDGQEKTVMSTRLEDAELKIRACIPDLDDKVTSKQIPQAIIAMVEADAVLRLIRNPEGYACETDGGYSYTLSERVASGSLDIVPSEWELLGIRGGVFTVDTVPSMPWAVSSG